MCHDPGLPLPELRAAAEALHAMLSTPSPAPATASPGGDKATPVPAGAGDPNNEVDG